MTGSSLPGLLLELVLGAARSDVRNQVSLEGLSARRGDDGKLLVEAARAELSGLKVEGPVRAPPAGAAPASTARDAWSLAPLAAADGTLRAEIVDAHLIFDANVKVTIRNGHVDFNEATVEHVGPDSRMGVSRMGVYVDAPNGRSYLYQFPSPPVAGVEYEQRGALLGARVSRRGSLRLQDFVEGLLRQGAARPTAGITDQARLLFARTSVSGFVQLGDGRVAAPGVQAELVGRRDGRNVVRLHSQAVGRELTIGIESLSLRNVVAAGGPLSLRCDHVVGELSLRLFLDGGALRFAFTVARLTLSGLHLVPAI